MKITILAGSGIGGTEKAAFLFAGELSKRGHAVDLLTDPDGPRSATLRNSGVNLLKVPYESAALESYLRSAGPDVIHQHVSGYGDHRPLYQALETLGAGRPKLIETNVFGQLWDVYDRGFVDFRMFVSMTSGIQAFFRPQFRKSTMSLERCSVLYNPLPEATISDSSLRTDLRKEFGIPDDELLLIRVGRPGNKWARWECEAYAIAKKQEPKLRLLLMEPPEDIALEIGSGCYGEGILIRKATSDFAYLDRLYQAADLMLHASAWGESYGYTLAEGLQVGLPVIARTTPWGDNAQTELVKNGKNGFVCCGVRGMASAILCLTKNLSLRKEFSQSAKISISNLSDLSVETDLLEEIMNWVVKSEMGSEMVSRHGNWMEYAARFKSIEWDVFERMKSMPLLVASGKFYALFRKIKFWVGSFLRRTRQA